MLYLLAALTVFLTMLTTVVMRWLARRWQVLDRPDTLRKFHERSIPLLGGVALYVAFWFVVFCLLKFYPVFGLALLADKLQAAFVGSTLLLIIGIADDVWGLKPALRLGATAVAVGLTVVAGVGLEKITNPFGGVIVFAAFVPALLAFIWLIGIIYTVKIVDGLDGLATGVVGIATLMIFFLAMSVRFYQPNVALLALLMTALCAAFLLFNFSPATIFLGEAGGLFLGFMLGVLAIISGSKVAIAFIVLAVPIVDLARVIIMRWREHRPIFSGDRAHLHYALLDFGWNKRQVVLFYYAVATLFGGAALFLQSFEKLLVIAVLVVLLAGFGLYVSQAQRV